MSKDKSKESKNVSKSLKDENFKRQFDFFFIKTLFERKIIRRFRSKLKTCPAERM